MFTTTPLALFKILETGTAEQIQEAVHTELNEKAEAFLESKKLQVVAEMFAEPFKLGEMKIRAKWNKASIREALETVAMRDLNESSDHIALHGVLNSKGWGNSFNSTSGNHYSHAKHPGHEIHINKSAQWTHSKKGKVIAGSRENSGSLNQWLSHFHTEYKPKE